MDSITDWVSKDQRQKSFVFPESAFILVNRLLFLEIKHSFIFIDQLFAVLNEILYITSMYTGKIYIYI